MDHVTRRQDLVEALWRVLRRDGIAAVSVRRVAAEAGTSPSALRHYFATQDELLGFALQAVVDRVADRVAPLLPSLHGRTGARTILHQLLPLDPDRRNEVEVYLAFVTRAALDPTLRGIRDRAETATRAAVRHALQLLADAGDLRDGRSVDAETDRTYPLVDGLALHSILWPDRYPPAHVREVLDGHLAGLGQPADRQRDLGPSETEEKHRGAQ